MARYRFTHKLNSNVTAKATHQYAEPAFRAASHELNRIARKLGLYPVSYSDVLIEDALEDMTVAPVRKVRFGQ